MSFLRAGQQLKHYRVVRQLGEGGMGEVYLAEDTRLGRRVAVKVLTEGTARDEKARLRLLQEARAASALSHPGIVTIHSIEDQDGFHFIVMEYVEGETLRAAIARGAFELEWLLEVGAQIADALAAAHAAGIVHRDIKSENILLTPTGRVKVLDFGLAKPFAPALRDVDTEAPTRLDLTGAGILIGTVAYMSPEQTRGEPLDARSDLFSLGTVLYEAATGRLPFGGPSVLSIAHEIATVNPPPPSTHRPGLPFEFDLVVERALAKDRAMRFASASELAETLRSLLGANWAKTPGHAAPVEKSPEGKRESFVGREAELKLLDGFLGQADEGAGSVVFVTGESGIGKSALVSEFLRRARRQHPPGGLLVARGRCAEQYGPGEAYLPFLDAIGGLLGGPWRERIIALLRTYAPTWCMQFPAALVSTTALEMISQETIPPSKERMLREMGDALASLATGSTVILLLEDLHWADPSSIDLLRHLGQRARDHRLLIVGTFPHGDVEASGHPLRMFKLEMEAHQQCEEIALGALGREHVAAYLNARFSPNDFPCQLATLIQRKTEGHSLFAFSLIQFLAESGDIARTDGLWSLARPLSEMDIEAPENVRSMIRKKIEALADEDRRMLQYASVEGEEFTSTVVAALLGVDDLEVEERLAAVERIHRMIVTCGEEELPDGGLATRYRFAHALYQHVLYGDLVSKRRILLHRQAGEQLLRQYGAQSARVAAQLALHFERGRDFKRAVAHLCAAGENATRLFANAVAVEHYDHALRLAEKLAEEEQAGVSLMLHQKRGAANHSLGKFQQAAEDFTEMLELARSLGSAAQESAALNALTMTLFYSHRLDEITARADEILRAAERAGSESLRVEAMQVLALKHLGQGELAAARPMLDEIIRGARALDLKPVLLTGLAWRGILHFFQTEYEVAAEVLAEARRLAGELRDSFLLLETYFVLGMVRGNQGRMSEALAIFDEGLNLAQRYGDQFWSPRMPNCVGWIYRELQDFGEAIRHDREGLEIGRQHGVVEAQANSLINLGVDYGHAGESEKTPAAFGKVEGIFRRDDWFSWRYRLRLLAGKCEHRLSRRDFAKAEAHAQALLEEASRYEARKYTAVAHKLLAQLAAERGDLAAAEDHLSAAIAQLHTHPVSVVEWKVYALLGRVRLRRDDPAGAHEAFGKSAAIVFQIAESVRDLKLRETFLDSSAAREVLAASGALALV